MHEYEQVKLQCEYTECKGPFPDRNSATGDDPGQPNPAKASSSRSTILPSLGLGLNSGTEPAVPVL